MENTNRVASWPQEIASGTRVKDPIENIEYELKRHLGSGKYSHVYLAAPVCDMPGLVAAQSKVVKYGSVSPEEMSDPLVLDRRRNELTRRYDEELQISGQIRAASENRYVPTIIRGEWVDSELASIPVLIMDRMGSDEQDWSLALQIRQLREEGQILEAERLAVRSGVQYAELLKILHQTLNKACPDRKPGDFYWDPHGDRLYVLDWNVVEDLLPKSQAAPWVEGPVASERLEKIQTEIRQFGERWFEMLIGNFSSAIGELSVDQPRPDSPWAALSRGMRRLLLRTLSTGYTQNGFKDDDATMKAWEVYWVMFCKSAYDLHKLAETKRDEARQDGENKDSWNAAWDTIKDIQDLLEAAKEPSASTWVREIKGWVVDHDRELEQQYRKKIEEGKQSIDIGDYDKAMSPFRAVTADDRFNAGHRVEATRWLFAAQMLSAATSEGWQRGKALEDQLLPLLEDMQKEQWNTAKRKLETIKHEDL